jgi:elongation factor Ts
MSSHSNPRLSRPFSGAVTSYIHAGGKIGVLLEVGCESDFVARTDDFLDLSHDIAMHIAASCPKFIRKEHVSSVLYEHKKEAYRVQAAATGKPSPVIDKIVEGKMAKFYEEFCLYEQPFIKDQTISVSQLIASTANKLGEEIAVRRFARVKSGDTDIILADDPDWRLEGGNEAGVTADKPNSPKARSGSAAARLDTESE